MAVQAASESETQKGASFLKLFGSSEGVLHFKSEFAQIQQDYAKELSVIRSNVENFYAPVRREEIERNLHAVRANAFQRKNNNRILTTALKDMKARKRIIVRIETSSEEVEFHRHSTCVNIFENIREFKDVLSQKLPGIDALMSREQNNGELAPRQEIYYRFSDVAWQPMPDLMWTEIKREYTAYLDTATLTSVYFFLIRRKLSAYTAQFLKQQFQLHENFHFQVLDGILSSRLFENNVRECRIIENIPLTVDRQSDGSAHLDGHTVMDTFKLWFCPMCMLFDCQEHSRRQEAYNSSHFYSPKTMTPKDYAADYAQLRKHLQQMQIAKGPKRSQDENIRSNYQQNICSSNCYLRLKYEDFQQEVLTPELSPFLQAFIQSFVTTLSFKPCLIAVCVDLTCARVFAYFIKNMRLQEIYGSGNQNNLTGTAISKRLTPPRASLSSEESTHDTENVRFQVPEDDEVIEPQLVKKRKLEKRRDNQVSSALLDSASSSAQARRLKIIMDQDHTEYFPCKHYFMDSEDGKAGTTRMTVLSLDCSDCHCAKKKFCDKYCLCDKTRCKWRRTGCLCRGNCSSNQCTCWSYKMECDPELCAPCYSGSKECYNHSMTSGCEKRHFIGKSVLCGGLGLFAGETVHRGEMVLEYKGQIMLSEEHWLHAEWVPDVFYSFRLSEKSDNWTLDSLHFGNNARYINHASSRELENIIARSVYTLGALHLGLYATKDIYFGEEFAFNYDGDNTLCEKFEWIKPSARERGQSHYVVQLQDDNDEEEEGYNYK